MYRKWYLLTVTLFSYYQLVSVFIVLFFFFSVFLTCHVVSAFGLRTSTPFYSLVSSIIAKLSTSQYVFGLSNVIFPDSILQTGLLYAIAVISHFDPSSI